jgi:hypothetical protein
VRNIPRPIRSAPRAALACIAFAACLPAATDPWLKITSANFELYTTAGERAGRDLVRHFEQVRSFFPAGLRQPPVRQPSGADHRLQKRKGVSTLPAQ